MKSIASALSPGAFCKIEITCRFDVGTPQSSNQFTKIQDKTTQTTKSKRSEISSNSKVCLKMGATPKSNLEFYCEWRNSCFDTLRSRGVLCLDNPHSKSTPKKTPMQSQRNKKRSRLLYIHINAKNNPPIQKQIQIANSPNLQISTSSSFLGCITSSGIRAERQLPQCSCQGSRRRPSEVPARQRLTEEAPAEGRDANNSWVRRVGHKAPGLGNLQMR